MDSRGAPCAHGPGLRRRRRSRLLRARHKVQRTLWKLWELRKLRHNSLLQQNYPPPPLFFPLPNSPPSFRLLLHIRLILLLLLPASSPPSVSSPLHPSSPPSYIFLFLFFFSIISFPHLSVCPSVGWLVGCWPVCHNFLSVIISLTDRREVSLLCSYRSSCSLAFPIPSPHHCINIVPGVH